MELPLLYREVATLFLSPLGERVLTELKRLYHDRPCAYVLGATTSHDLAFLEGQRSVVMAIQEYIDMFIEQQRGETDGRDTRPRSYDSGLEGGDTR